MRIDYTLERLPGLHQASPMEVDFESLSSCPVCCGDQLVDVTQLRDSLITSWCRRCGHGFHRRRPNAAWCRDWYREGWDAAAARNWRPSRWRTARRSASARLIGAAKRVVDQRGRTLMRGAMYDFCRSVVDAGDAVLDIGCGYGESLRPFAQRGCRVFGVEASEHRAMAARERGVETSNTTVEQLAPDTFGATFDLVISTHVIEHVVDPQAFMEGIRRVLRPGGWICLAAPNLAHDFLVQNAFFALHLHHYSQSSLRRLLTQHGFVVERCQEEHELRMLAQLRPEKESHARLRTLDAFSLDPRSVATGILGEGFHAAGRSQGSVRCRWRLNDRPMGQRYDVFYDSPGDVDDKHEALSAGRRGWRSMTMRWHGPVELPIEFAADDGPAPFWIK